MGGKRPFLLTEAHSRAAEVLAAGGTTRAAAEAGGTDRKTLRQWMRNVFFREAVETLQKETLAHVKQVVSGRLLRAAPDAADQVVALSGGARQERVKLQASQDVLDRAGFKPVERRATSMEMVMSDETAHLIKQVLGEIERRRARGPAPTREIPVALTVESE